MVKSQTAIRALLRDRDLFVHDGDHLRRVRLSLPVQMAFLMVTLVLLAWSAFATYRYFAPVAPGAAPASMARLAAATELRARQIEQRQEVIAAMLAGDQVSSDALPETTAIAPLPAEIAGKLARVEDRDLKLADAASRELDARYAEAVVALKARGVSPKRLAVGGPYEPLSGGGDQTFKKLFTSWKKLDNLQDGAIAVPSDKPVKLGGLTSGYGVRNDPFRNGKAMHAGIDLSGPQGTPIYATADGLVLRSGWNSGGYGNLVELDHGKGIATRYGHLSKITVAPGQRIRRGQQIGMMGSTGRSTGSHLHYEVRIDGRPVNPIPFMKSTDYIVAMKEKGAVSMDSTALGGPGAKR